MAEIGYHASHEQFSPAELLALTKQAEASGFAAAMSSDHLAPWGERQGHSGFAWSWLGAAMQAARLPFGVVTTPIGLRYHPLLVAQAAATLAEMFPRRLTVILGSGEALNERAFGAGWPIKQERTERLEESVDILRALWRGETVTRNGRIAIDEGRLYSLPETPPALFCAALTPQTARRSARWADGLATINQPLDKVRELIAAFRDGGGDGKPVHLQLHLSFAATEEEATRNALDQWRTNALPSTVAAELSSPQMFDAATEHLRAEDLSSSVLVSADLSRHRGWIEDFFALGVDRVLLHNVGRNQREFIDAFGKKVLPQFHAE
jgi:coenzyme F420-dependent glucose-6-phosphate dehydrogenase